MASHAKRLGEYCEAAGGNCGDLTPEQRKVCARSTCRPLKNNTDALNLATLPLQAANSTNLARTFSQHTDSEMHVG